MIELCRFLIDVVIRHCFLACCAPHLVASFEGGRVKLNECTGKCGFVPRRNEPAVFLMDNEFGYPVAPGCDDDTPKRHRFHDDCWESFGITRYNQAHRIADASTDTIRIE